MTIGPYKIIKIPMSWHVTHDGCEHWFHSLDYLKKFLLEDKRLSPQERIKIEDLKAP